jgi:hypothetical protein
LAAAKPIPLVPPVMTAILPSSLSDMVFSVVLEADRTVPANILTLT